MPTRSIWTDLERVELLLSLQRFAEAEQLVRQVLAAHPDHALAMGWLGVCLLHQQHPAEALQFLRRAIVHAPLDPLLFAWLAEAHLAVKDFSAAQEAATEALRLAPWQADFHGLMGMVLLRQLRLKQAVRAARTGLAIDPSNKQCLTIQARALAALGQTHSSARLFTPVLAADPSDAIAHANQGFNYLDAGNFRAAQAHFLTALRQQPGNAQIRQGLLEALKSAFWFYRAIGQGTRRVIRLVQLTGFFRLEADTRKLLAYVLLIPLLFFVWGWAFVHGFFSNISYFAIGLRLLLLTPLGLILILAFVSAVLQGFMLTLLRYHPLARPYISGKEVMASNCFLVGLGAAGAGAGAYFAGYFN